MERISASVGDRVVDHGARDALRRLAMLGGALEQGDALPGERVERSKARLRLFEREARGSGTVDVVAEMRTLEAFHLRLMLVELVLQDEAFGVTLVLAPAMLIERAPKGDDLVGEQARTGVAHDRRDRRGFAGDLGLTAERLQLSSDLAGEIGEPGQVRLHRIELAKRLLLAAAVLEDSGGLLDEAASIFGGRPEHLVELALSDDHVHLTAEPGVAEELLHVEQAAGLAVDRVLARAVAEEGARDRDLAVLDRQRAVGVVDGEAHLGSTERPTRGGAGEDDVLHLAAAQRLGTLFAHDPRQRVDDVGLPRAVGSDDAGHAGLERERRRLREGLEALERQALQVHVPPSPACEHAADYGIRGTPRRRARAPPTLRSPLPAGAPRR